jgi:hypothetical protein
MQPATHARTIASMHIEFGTALVLATLLAAVVLLVQKSDRMFPTVAVVAAGIEALMAFGVLSLTLAKFRVDVILPGLLVLSGGVCWAKSSTKSAITSATIVTLVGMIQLMLALRLFK